MAWIRVISQGEEKGDLADQYSRIRSDTGRVPNILAVHSLNPPALKAHYDLYRTLMFGRSDLTRAQREMIAVVVSVENECHY
jgi:uncharacterized peroxidase-related enzyme